MTESTQGMEIQNFSVQRMIDFKSKPRKVFFLEKFFGLKWEK